MRVKLRFEDRAFRRFLKNAPKAARAASVSALNKGNKKVASLVVKATAAEVSLPQKIIRKRLKTHRATSRALSASNRIVTWKVTDADTLRARQTRKGVSARGHAWPSAFIQRSPRGRKRIYKRIGKARYPIRTEGVDIHEAADRNLRRINKREGARVVNKLLPHEMKWRMDRAAR